MKSPWLVLSLLPLVLSPFLAAQDSRIVTEPVIPPACATVDAQLQATGHTLAEADEAKLDTARIQKAIDRCGKGRGVVLRAQGAANAFLSGPLILSSGVTLIVDKGRFARRLSLRGLRFG